MKSFIITIQFLWWMVFTKEGRESVEEMKEQEACKHEKWFMDKQIRTIECCECGKRAWVEDYKDLYPNF